MGELWVQGPKFGMAASLVTGFVLVWMPIAIQTRRYHQSLRAWAMSPVYAIAAMLVTWVVMMPVLLVLAKTFNVGTKTGPSADWFLLMALPVGGLVAWWYVNRQNWAAPDRLHRGAQIADSAAWLKETARAKKAHGDQVLTLAGIFVNEDDETKHFKILGTTGAGKSTAIRELMGQALKRGDRAVFADPGGDYLSRFYDPARGDVILNPFDPRSLRWDLFGEFSERYEVDQLVRSLIPAEDEWSGYARTFVSAVIGQCAQRGAGDLPELWRLISSAPRGELQQLLEGTPAQPFLDDDNARMFGSIRAVTVSALAALQYVCDQPAGAPFSVRQWVRTGKGVLFLSYQPEQIAALSALIATWVRLAIFQTMGLGDVSQTGGTDRRLWFVIDELDALGRINGLKDALARLRKAGGRCVLGFQSIAQVSAIYGQGEARTIVENCSNTLILRCSGSEGGGTSDFASNLIGQREIVRQTVSTSESGGGLLQRRQSSVSYGQEYRTEHAVLASEIEALPDRRGFLKAASSEMWVRVEISSN